MIRSYPRNGNGRVGADSARISINIMEKQQLVLFAYASGLAVCQEGLLLRFCAHQQTVCEKGFFGSKFSFD